MVRARGLRTRLENYLEAFHVATADPGIANLLSIFVAYEEGSHAESEPQSPNQRRASRSTGGDWNQARTPMRTRCLRGVFERKKQVLAGLPCTRRWRELRKMRTLLRPWARLG